MAQYYIGKNNQRKGPFPLEQLIANGITPDTLVWCSGMPGWKRAIDVPEVAVLFAPQQPPQPQYAPPVQDYQQPYQQPYQQQQYGYQQPQYQQPPYGQYGYGVDYKQQLSDQHFAAYGYRPQVDFGESIKICFNKFADFTGRARRSEYWWFYLFNTLVSWLTCGFGGLVCFIPMMAVTVRRLHDTNRSGWWYFMPMILSVVFIIVLASLGIFSVNSDKELQNIMMGTGAVVYIVFLLAMLFFGIALLVFCCTDSNRDTNKYGPSPKYQ